MVDVKELLKLYDRVTIHLPRIRREHSAVKRFEDAAYNIIHNFTIAFEMRNEDEKQMKRMYVERIIGSFGEMLAAFEILMDMRAGTQKVSDVEITSERIMTLTQTETGRKNYATQRDGMENLDGDNTTLWLFLRRNGVQPFKGSMSYFCVERSGSTILNLVPMISPSNVVGMYDTIGQKFYSSPNGETFVAGSELLL